MLLSQLVAKSLEYNRIKNKTQATLDEFCNFVLENVKIKKYLSLVEKNIVIEKILSYSSLLDADNVSPQDYISNLEYRIFIDGLLKYTDIVMDEEYRKIVAYDILIESEIDQILLAICGNDFNLLRSMIKDAIDYSLNISLRQVIVGLNKNRLGKNIKELKDVLNNKEVMDKLYELSIMNDSDIRSRIDELQRIDTKQLLDALRMKKSDVNDI